MTVLHRALSIVVSGMLLASCRAAVDAYSPENPVLAARMAGDVVASLQFRFERPIRDSAYEAARLRIARYAMAPGKLRNDSAWTSIRGARHDLTAMGQLQGGRYRFVSLASPPLPTTLGASRHFVSLDTLSDGDWLWRTQVDQALGSVSPAALGRVLTALLRSAERPAEQIRRDYRKHAPAATSSIGRLASLDSISTVQHLDGSTSVQLLLRLSPAKIAREYPAFSRYLTKYISPSRYRIGLRDPVDRGVHAADEWIVIEGADNRIAIRFRSRHGELQPLEGPLRDRPDTLAIQVSASVKFGLFTVGVRDMRGQFVFLREPGEVGWDMRFRGDPDWDLPPLAGRLVKGSLMRPFQGDGALLRLSVRQHANGQALLHREATFAVQESTIMRWLGNLGFTAMDEFSGDVEAEEARFFAGSLRALRRDVSQLGAR